MPPFWNQRGMTLIELTLVTIIILVTTGLSVPLFFHLRERRFAAEFENMQSTVQAGIMAWHARELLEQDRDHYPKQLDAQTEQSECLSCFEVVLDKPLKHPLWIKQTAGEYWFVPLGKLKPAMPQLPRYRLVYDPVTGSFQP